MVASCVRIQVRTVAAVRHAPESTVTATTSHSNSSSSQGAALTSRLCSPTSTTIGPPSPQCTYAPGLAMKGSGDIRRGTLCLGMRQPGSAVFGGDACIWHPFFPWVRGTADSWPLRREVRFARPTYFRAFANRGLRLAQVPRVAALLVTSLA